MSLESVRAFFAAHAPDIPVLVTEASSATVSLAAEAHGVCPEQIAKTICLRVGNRMMLIVTSGTARLDNRKFKDRFGGKARMLDAEQVLETTSHPVGGVCPFGLPSPLAVYCDVSLQAFDEVVPPAGVTKATVRLSPRRMARTDRSRMGGRLPIGETIMGKRKTIVPSTLKSVYEHWHFAPAVVSKGMVYCSGIIGTSVDGEAPGKAALEGAQATTRSADAQLSALQAVRDPEAQFATAFEALAAILAEAGASLADIVEFTTYHVDIARHMETFLKVRDRYLKEPWPAWTAIGVCELVVPGGLLEIRAIAALPEK